MTTNEEESIICQIEDTLEMLSGISGNVEPVYQHLWSAYYNAVSLFKHCTPDSVFMDKYPVPASIRQRIETIEDDREEVAVRNSPLISDSALAETNGTRVNASSVVSESDARRSLFINDGSPLMNVPMGVTPITEFVGYFLQFIDRNDATVQTLVSSQISLFLNNNSSIDKE